MLDRIFGGDTFVAQTRALDAASLRQQVIAHNLANANTPGFKRQEVQFETQLTEALNARNSSEGPSGFNRMDNVTPRVVTLNSTSERTDGNNVDMEAENVLLAENTLRYEALTQSVGGYFSALKTVINGR